MNGGGEGAPVVLVHGAGVDHTVWRFQTRWLASRGYEVHAPDLPGHGARPGPALPTVTELGEWLCSLLTGPATVVGHSMGSLVAVEAAAQRPDLVERLVLVGTAPRFTVHTALLAAARADDDLAAQLMAGWSFPKAFGGGHPEAGTWEQGGLTRLIQRSAPGVLATDLAACETVVSRAAEVSAEALLISGSEDRMTPVSGAEEVAGMIPGARVVALAGSGHEPMLQVPVRFNEVLGEFLTSRAKSASR